MLKCANIFGNGMILQREKEVAVFGTADAGDTITVQLLERNISVEGTVDSNRNFCVYLPPQSAGEACTMIVSNTVDDMVEFENVLFGEVWLAAGQSNMELTLVNCMQGEMELAELASKKQAKEIDLNQDGYSFVNANPLLEQIRFYSVVKAPYDNTEWLQKQEENCWHTILDEEVKDLSAIAYFAAKSIHRTLEVPVGIIQCCHGGTSVACWMAKDYLPSFEDGAWYYQQYADLVGDKSNEEYLAEMADYQVVLADYNQRVEAVKADAKERGEELTGEQINDLVGPYPWPEPQGWLSPYRPAGLFQTMLSKVIPYGIRGVWYYQGEEDAPRYERYEVMLTNLIIHWRDLWKNQMEFLIVGLPMFLEKGCEDDASWAKIRLIQHNVAKSIACGHFVPLHDLGEFDNVHPVDKKTPGERIGQYCLHTVYGLDETKGSIDGNEKETSSLGDAMTLKQAVVCEDTVRLQFDYSYGQIMLNTAFQGLEPALMEHKMAKTHGILAEGFEIAGDDMCFGPATAIIEGDEIILYSEHVDEPKYVRYAYANYMRANVYNGIGLPLVPFTQ